MLSALLNTAVIMTGYEASGRFWARIIMHMYIMRIIPIIMLSLRRIDMSGLLLSFVGSIIFPIRPEVNREFSICFAKETKKIL